jgi:hypothetical protein
LILKTEKEDLLIDFFSQYPKGNCQFPKGFKNSQQLYAKPERKSHFFPGFLFSRRENGNSFRLFDFLKRKAVSRWVL